MATIARLIVDVTGDNTGLRQTFVDSAARSQQFVRSIEDTMRRSSFQLIDPRKLNELESQLSSAQNQISRFVQGANNSFRSLDTGRFVGRNAASAALANIEQLKAQIAAEQQAIAQQLHSPAGESAANEAGIKTATEFIAAMRAELETGAQQLKESIFRGLLTPEEARERAVIAADAYNQTLLQSISSLRSAGVLTPGVEAALIAGMEKAGLEAGTLYDRALAQGIKQSEGLVIAGAQAGMTALARTSELGGARIASVLGAGGEGFKLFGHLAEHSLVGAGFAMANFATGTESALPRLLHSISTFSLFAFGDKGLIVAGVLIAGEAIFKMFENINKQADETMKKLNQTVSSAANEMNQTVLKQQLRDFTFGQPTSVDPKTQELIINKPSQFARFAFENSPADLEARLQRVNDQITAAQHTANLALVLKLSAEQSRLENQLKPLREKAAQITTLINQPPERAPLIQDLTTVAVRGKTGNAAAAEAARLEADQIEILVDRFELARSTGRNFSGELAEIITKLGNLGSDTRRASESLDDYRRRLDAMKQLRGALDNLTPKINIDVNVDALNDQLSKKFTEKWNRAFDQRQWETSLTHDFDQMIAQVQVFRDNAALTNAARVASGQKPIDIERLLEPMKQAALREALRIRAILLSSGLDPRLYQPIIDQLIKGIDAIGTAGDKAAKKLANIGKEIQKVANVLSSLASLNDVLGGSERTTKILQDASSAANSVASAIAKGGKDPAADIQALADVIRTLKDVFGAAGEIRDENNKVVKENRERLKEVALRLAGFNTNANNSLSAGQAAAALLANNAAREAFTRGATHAGGFLGTQTKGDLQTQIDALDPFLKSVGLTFDQFKKIVADAGFQIFDKFGRIIPEALQQFANHVEDVIKALFTFQNTLSDQQTLASLRSKLSGVDQTPVSDLKQQLAILQQLAPNLLPGQFDVSSAAGQEVLRKALAALVERLATGGIDPSQFGAFQNLGELTTIIDALATALLGLKSTADSVTESISNVPVGFKIAPYRFDAANAEPWGRSLAPRGGPVGDPLVNLPPTMGGNVTFIIQDGAVRLSGIQSDNPEKFGQKALEGLQELAITKLGNAARWPEMN